MDQPRSDLETIKFLKQNENDLKKKFTPSKNNFFLMKLPLKNLGHKILQSTPYIQLAWNQGGLIFGNLVVFPGLFSLALAWMITKCTHLRVDKTAPVLMEIDSCTG